MPVFQVVHGRNGRGHGAGAVPVCGSLPSRQRRVAVGRGTGTKGRKQMREEARNERTKGREAGADDSRVAFDGGPGCGVDIIVYKEDLGDPVVSHAMIRLGLVDM